MFPGVWPCDVEQIDQICVRGDRELGWLLALVVVSSKFVEQWQASHPDKPVSLLSQDPEVKVSMLLRMQQVGEQHGLKPYEHIKVRVKARVCHILLQSHGSLLALRVFRVLSS